MSKKRPRGRRKQPGKVAAMLPSLLDEFAAKAEKLQEFLSPLAVGEAPHPLRVQLLHAAALLQLSVSEVRLRKFVSPLADPAQALVVAGGVFDLLLQQARALCLEGPGTVLTMPDPPKRMTYLFAQATVRFMRIFFLIVWQEELVLSEELAVLIGEPENAQFCRTAHALWLAVKELSGDSFPFNREQQEALALLLDPGS